MGATDKWIILINIAINMIVNFIEYKSGYRCPSYCEVEHKHIEVHNEFYNRLLGTTYSLCVACNNTNENESRHRCLEGQGKNSILTIQ
jgi:hypothetical protein